jgi:hypothetical protein
MGQPLCSLYHRHWADRRILFVEVKPAMHWATILFAAMIGALLFGLWNHFIAHGPDHVMHLQAGARRLPFQATALLLAVSESAGAIVALMLLYALTRQTKARIR